MTIDLSLLKNLCKVHAPSGSEYLMKEFLIDHIERHSKNWQYPFEIIHGKEFQDCIIILFGKPRTAIYAHMDSVGYTVGYHNHLIKIGGPRAEEGSILVGKDAHGDIKGRLKKEKTDTGELVLSLEFEREVERGTTLVYDNQFIADGDFVQSCYLDNRLGMYNALKVAETLKDGAIVFSSWEEVGGGSVGYLGKYLYEEHGIQQSLISDITWITEGVKHGEGVAISMRDSGIPRRSYLNKILDIASKSDIPYQLEVESAGGSDGNALQKSSYPIDWCFIGAGENNVHQPNETVHKSDIESMIKMYRLLMQEL